MGRPYSDDLREQVLKAVIQDVLSRVRRRPNLGWAFARRSIGYNAASTRPAVVKPDQIGGYTFKNNGRLRSTRLSIIARRRTGVGAGGRCFWHQCCLR
jgi:hypothetical protein